MLIYHMRLRALCAVAEMHADEEKAVSNRHAAVNRRAPFSSDPRGAGNMSETFNVRRHAAPRKRTIFFMVSIRRVDRAQPVRCAIAPFVAVYMRRAHAGVAAVVRGRAIRSGEEEGDEWQPQGGEKN